MRPDAATTQAFLYCLALAAKRFNVGVITFFAHRNHWHGVVVDKEGRLPDFLQLLHLQFAKHQNRLRGRSENFWSNEQASVVELLETDDIVEKCAYVLANPVKDGLVEKAHQWPGASALTAIRHPRTIVARRPKRFFRSSGTMPESVTLELHTPVEFPDRQSFRRLIDQRIAEIEATAAATRKGKKLRVVGPRRVLRQGWNERPSTTKPRRSLVPRISSKNKRACVEAIQRDRYWRAEYSLSRKRYAQGDRPVIFPAGTYYLARYASVSVAVIAEAPAPS